MVIGSVASLASVATSLVPLLDVFEMERSQSAIPITSISYISMWLNYTLWAIYGLFIGDCTAVTMTNLWGSALCTYYCYKVYRYVKFVERKEVCLNYLIGFSLFFLAGYYSFTSTHPKEIKVSRLGYVASVFSVLMNGSVLSQRS